MIYLLENSGDPFISPPYGNAVRLSYGDCLYFAIVTMSTVGYGDITPRTVLGKIFTSFFILFALAAFASCIPEIVDMFLTTSKYSGTYTARPGRRHVVVCGDVTTESVKHFLDDFLHPDRRRTDVEVVFMNRSKPDLRLQSLLRRHFSRVKYLEGTVMNYVDLDRVAMVSADACLILANSRAVDPAQEDAANIMRVVAVKNYAGNVRVIVQLLQQCNKSHLLNIPTWNWHAGDEIVCFSELKLGFLAQSCLAPGFSTLLTNLFSMRSLHGHEAVAGALVAITNASSVTPETGQQGAQVSPVRTNVVLRLSDGIQKLYHVSVRRRSASRRPSSNRHNFEVQQSPSRAPETFESPLTTSKEPWISEYLRGVSMELYSAAFSPAFHDMCFAEAAKICMQRLELMLIAILAQITEDGDVGDGQYPYLAINPPSSSHAIIREGAVGFFICDSQEIASRATNYCLRCHKHVTSYDQIRKCPCRNQGFKDKIRHLRDRISAEISDGNRSSGGKVSAISALSGPKDPTRVSEGSRAFRSCSRSVSRASTAESAPAVVQKSPHSESTLDITGVYHWCAKRSIDSAILPNNHNVQTSITEEVASKRLRNHILVCLLAGERAPRLGLRSFVLPLRASNITSNDIRPIIFIAPYAFMSEEWHELENFPDVYLLPGSPLNRRDLWAARIQLCSVCVVIGVAETVQMDDPYMLDKEAILCSLNIRALKIPPSLRHSVSEDIAARSSGSEIPLLTALAMDSNIHFLDPDDFETGNSDIDIFLTVPFARGLAFTGSVLDALVSTAYFDRNAMTLIRHLVTGGTTPVLEQWAAYGGDFYDNLQVTHTQEAHVNEFLETLRRNNTKRPTIAQLSFNDPRLATIMDDNGSSVHISFGNLFCRALEDYGILCLGLFRLNSSDQESPVLRRVRTSVVSLERSQITRRPSACSPIEPVKMRILFEDSNELRPPNVQKHYVDRLQLPLGPHSANNRYVITSPPYWFPVKMSDLVFCLIP